MDLIVNKKIILGNLHDILLHIKKLSKKEFFATIEDKGDNLSVTCPYHKNGQESHPSCQIYASRRGKLKFGTLHCFTCGASKSLTEVVAHCLEITIKDAEKWLSYNYGGETVYANINLEPIELNKEEQQQYLDESILQNFAYIHPYMYQRKLTNEIINKFKIGYSKETDSITFPVWDLNNNLVMITQRSVSQKRFYIPKSTQKPIYLGNFVVGKNYPYVIITEAQIDALTSWVYGVPSIASIGVPSQYQYDILNNTDLRNYILMFDNDDAGRKMTDDFKRNIRKDVIVNELNRGLVPYKKDINDLTKEEFDLLLNSSGFKWRIF